MLGEELYSIPRSASDITPSLCKFDILNIRDAILELSDIIGPLGLKIDILILEDGVN